MRPGPQKSWWIGRLFLVLLNGLRPPRWRQSVMVRVLDETAFVSPDLCLNASNKAWLERGAVLSEIDTRVDCWKHAERYESTLFFSLSLYLAFVSLSSLSLYLSFLSLFLSFSPLFLSLTNTHSVIFFQYRSVVSLSVSGAVCVWWEDLLPAWLFSVEDTSEIMFYLQWGNVSNKQTIFKSYLSV